MREKFLKFADDLIAQKNAAKIYENLPGIFEDICMFHEQGACYEKLWHITQEHTLYKKIGDIFGQKLGKFNVAYKSYTRYLQFSDPDFYKNYARVLVKLGYDKLKEEPDGEDYSREIVKLCDAYDTIVYMMIYLHKKSDFEGIIRLDEKLTAISGIINRYLSENPREKDAEGIGDNKASRKHLSAILSETPHRNDINFLAIKYDENNKRAYMNIIGDYITYKNYNEAKLFYNYTYANVFKLNELTNIVDICWEVSDFWRDIYDFYNAVFYQKCALELELEEVK